MSWVYILWSKEIGFLSSLAGYDKVAGVRWTGAPPPSSILSLRYVHTRRWWQRGGSTVVTVITLKASPTLTLPNASLYRFSLKKRVMSKFCSSHNSASRSSLLIPFPPPPPPPPLTPIAASSFPDPRCFRWQDVFYLSQFSHVSQSHLARLSTFHNAQSNHHSILDRVLVSQLSQHANATLEL